MDGGDKDTRAAFGDHVSSYDSQDAVDDGATVPGYHESRLARLDIDQAQIEQLDFAVEEVLDEVRQLPQGKFAVKLLQKLRAAAQAGARHAAVAHAPAGHAERRDSSRARTGRAPRRRLDGSEAVIGPAPIVA